MSPDRPVSSSGSLTVELVTPRGALLSTAVDVVSAPTPLGEISVLPHHMPLVTALVAGELRCRRGSDRQSFVVAGGVLVVRAGSSRDAVLGVATVTRVVVLADFAERAEEIAEAAAAEAYRRARDLREREATDERAFAAATAIMERELARLRVARKTKHAGRHGASRGVLGNGASPL